MSPWTAHFAGARSQLAQLEESLADLDSRLEAFREKFNEKFESDNGAEFTFRHENGPEFFDVALLEHSAELFAYLAVEGFLNDYGARRLGPSWYKANLERLRPGQKVAALFAACTGELIDPSDELMALCKIMFDRRNQMAHPKTKAIDKEFLDALGKPGNVHVPAEKAREAIRAMERFFELFAARDPDIEQELKGARREETGDEIVLHWKKAPPRNAL